jgi:hypothetical protein
VITIDRNTHPGGIKSVWKLTDNLGAASVSQQNRR